MSTRTTSIDACRGLAVILMVLDHTRDYLSNYPFSPTDLTHPDTTMFFMRFVTHFCAPWFVFLAGVGIGLSLTSGKSRASVSRFLLTRGLWLVFVELVIIRYGCFLDFIPSVFYMGIIWALGASMILLAALIYLPTLLLFALGLAGVALHNLLDFMTIVPADGLLYWLVFFFRNQGELNLGALTFDFDFPFGVWTCLAMLGIVFAKLWTIPDTRRIPILWMLACATTIAFLLLRGVFSYGDPTPFVAQSSSIQSILTFLNNEKYPPSLVYLLMTMSVGILFLAAYETFGWRLNVLQLFGRVPMFFYMVHFPIINTAALLWFFAMSPARVLGASMAERQSLRFDFGFNAPGIFLCWAVFLLLLYALCVKYAAFKKLHPHLWWVRYV